MLFKILKNSVIIRVNKFLLLFLFFIFIAILFGYFLLVQNYLNEMYILNEQIKVQLDLLQQKQQVPSLLAHSSHSTRSYWEFLSENVDPILIGVVLGAFVAGCFLGSQGFFSYETITKKDCVPSFPSSSSFKKVITDFDVDYTDIGLRIHTRVDGDRGVAHFISKLTDSPVEPLKVPLDIFLSFQAEIISTSTTSTLVSSEVAAEAAKHALLFSSLV